MRRGLAASSVEIVLRGQKSRGVHGLLGDMRFASTDQINAEPICLLTNLNKYSEQQKLDAVETYRSGDLGLRATAALLAPTEK